jgi:hypothetical protein
MYCAPQINAREMGCQESFAHIFPLIVCNGAEKIPSPLRGKGGMRRAYWEANL